MKTPPIEPEALARLHAERLAVELRPVIESVGDKIAKAISELPAEYFQYQDERKMFGG